MQTHRTVTLTPEHVAAIRHHIDCGLTAAGDLKFYLQGGDTPGALALLRALTAGVRILDQIGQHDGDGCRLRLDDETVWFMERMGDASRGCLEHSRQALIAPPRPEEPEGYHEELIRDARRLIDIDLDAIDAARLVRETVSASA